jgi:hypothetical protein
MPDDRDNFERAGERGDEPAPRRRPHAVEDPFVEIYKAPGDARARTSSAIGLLALVVSTVALRHAVHFWWYGDPIALLEIGSIDLAVLALVPIAAVLGALLGRAPFSVALFAVGVGLPLVGCGYAASALWGNHVSNMLGFVSLVGIGSGLALRGPVGIGFGVLFVAGGSYGLVSIHQLQESLLIVAPHALVFAGLATWSSARWLAGRKRPASARHQR